MEGSFVFNRASGKDLTSDIVEKLEKSANRGKHRLLDHRDLTPFYKTISKDGESMSVLYLCVSFTFTHPRRILFFFTGGGTVKRGKRTSAKKDLSMVQARCKHTCFISIVEQCHKSLKWLIVFLNEARFGNTFQKLKVKQQTFILHSPGITSVSSIPMRDY